MQSILITTSSFGEQSPELLQSIETPELKFIHNRHGRKLTESEVDHLIQEHRPVGLIAGVEPLTRYVLERAAFLKVISRCGIGMDTVDLIAAKELGIQVTNTPDAPTIPVAELTIGLALSLLRSIHIVDASIRNGSWERPMGSLLHGKTAGIIGYGRIGSYVSKLLSSFGCNQLIYDPYADLVGKPEASSIEELIENADIVFLHLPYTAENHHMLNAERLSLMKPGAILINTSRGGLIDDKALFDSLKSRRFAGAAIDCFEEEPYTGPLSKLKNTLITSHIGSYAREGRMLMEQQAVENLLTALRNLNPKD